MSSKPLCYPLAILGALYKVIQADGRDLVNVWQLGSAISSMDCKLPRVLRSSANGMES